MNCNECQNEVKGKYMGTYAKIMEDKGLCFSCAFWEEKVDRKDRPEVARIDGKHYVIGREESIGFSRGFGGANFTIRFFDGREVRTTNLWHQGKIPTHFRDRLPDNAEFIRGEKAWLGK